MTSYQTVHKLRNHPRRCFTIDAKLTSSSPTETIVTLKIQEMGCLSFTYLIEFSKEFVATKENFDSEMYLRTAAAIACSQIESLQHSSTRIRVYHGSGLMATEPLPS